MDYTPILISLKTAAVSIAVTFFLGIWAAHGVAWMKNEKWKAVIDALFTLPLVLPPTVAGFFLLYLFGVNRPVGEFFLNLGVKIVFSWGATVIASVLISFPLMYRSARGAFEQVDGEIVDAARTLGLREGRVFWRVVMPVALPGVISGAVLAFARGLGEFGATAMIAGNIAGKTRTLPLAIYSAVAGGDMRVAGDYVLVAVLICFLAVVGINAFTMKGMRREKR